MARALLLASYEGASHLPLPLLAAFLAFVSTTLIISALCASHNRKSRHGSPSPSKSSSENHVVKGDEKMVVLPATHGPIARTDPPGLMTPRRKLSVSLSLKIPEGLSRVRTGRKEAQDKERTAAAVAAEESVWMKTIILGEKCKVPENGQVEADEGNRHRNYHPRTPRSMPVSRTNSFIIVPAS